MVSYPTLGLQGTLKSSGLLEIGGPLLEDDVTWDSEAAVDELRPQRDERVGSLGEMDRIVDVELVRLAETSQGSEREVNR